MRPSWIGNDVAIGLDKCEGKHKIELWNEPTKAVTITGSRRRDTHQSGGENTRGLGYGIGAWFIIH